VDGFEVDGDGVSKMDMRLAHTLGVGGAEMQWRGPAGGGVVLWCPLAWLRWVRNWGGVDPARC